MKKHAEIVFDESCIGWSHSEEFNTMYIQTHEQYTNDLLRNKGYVYLNQIYNMFDVKWDPNNVNEVCIYSESECIHYTTTFKKNGVIIISVLW